MNLSLNAFKWSVSNIISIIIIALLIIPQTRKPLQLQIQKMFAQFSPSIETEVQTITNLDFRLQSVNGEPFNLNETNGKVKLISFWATWCPPCVAELPSLQALYNEFGEDVEFVFISNESPEVILKFLEKNNYNFPVYSPVFQPQSMYLKPNTIPRTLLLDHKNRVRIFKEGAANWHSDKVRALISKLVIKYKSYFDL